MLKEEKENNLHNIYFMQKNADQWITQQVINDLLYWMPSIGIGYPGAQEYSSLPYQQGV